MTMPVNSATNAASEAQRGTTAGVTPTSPRGYELIDEIGRGGMGVVYRARDAALDRDVAVKLLSERYPPDSLPSERFLSEARITGQLQHPGIPAVHQVGTLADGRPFLAMKLIKGNTLEAILKQRTDPAADRGRLLAIFEAVCQAVGYAHAHRVIHRDLKPANVMVGAFGEVQVMDWGLAKVLGEETPATADTLAAEQTRAGTQVSPTPKAGSHTQAGSLVGTPAFIPPEQALGEIDKVNERSDVFGLGALLAVILTGKPPYVGETAESVRVQAVRGKLEDCFIRLDVSGAEPELVALCKGCLAFEPVDRPADAGAVAQAVAGWRAAADERARWAELERVRVEGEQATAAARSAERRKRRRLVLGAAAVLAVAAVGGLTAVLAVQRQANVQLEAKNAALADEQAKVQARFDLAVKAIETFHTGVSEDFLLKNPEFKELRTKLLKEAAGFYADLEKLLAGKTDAKSRQALAEAYFQLAELTDKIGTKREALAVHRRALAVRQELAAEPGAGVETRLDVARSHRAIGSLLRATGDLGDALAAFQSQRDLAAALESEAPTDAVRAQLAYGHYGIGAVLFEAGKPAEALKEFHKSLAIRQQLADANVAVPAFQYDLAQSHRSLAYVLIAIGQPAEALEANRKALPIFQKLVDNLPAVTNYRYNLAVNYGSIGWDLLKMGKPVDGVQASRKALEIMQKLLDDHPANTQFQFELANYHTNIGRGLARQGRLADAVTAIDAGLVIRQKLAKADPNNAFYSRHLIESHTVRRAARVRAGQPVEAAADLRRVLEVYAKLPHPDIEVQVERSRALALLAGLAADGKSGVTAAEAAAFSDQAVAALRDAISAGWGWPDELKEPDIDPLRGREDFKKVLAEAEAKVKAAAKDK
jgi:tetratricopeptide (TPR) repeat protein